MSCISKVGENERLNENAPTEFDRIRSDVPLGIIHWSPLSYIISHIRAARVSRANCRINISPPRGPELSGIAERSVRPLKFQGSRRDCIVVSSDDGECCWWSCWWFRWSLALLNVKCLSRTRASSFLPDEPAWPATFLQQRAEEHDARWSARKMIRSVVNWIILTSSRYEFIKRGRSPFSLRNASTGGEFDREIMVALHPATVRPIVSDGFCKNRRG